MADTTMKLKDQDGCYNRIVPIAIMIATVLYTLFCIFVAFPWIDKVAGR